MNQQKINYQKELDKIISALEQKGEKKTLLLHSCCAPCSSYVLEYLSRYFYITVFYYNPNIYPPKEYDTRMEEQKRLVSQMPVLLPVRVVEADYEPELFFEMIRGMEWIPEGGERCFLCYEMRMRKAAAYAADQGFDYFTTTLSISPLKNAGKLNEIGLKLAEETGVPYLVSDFKKKNGYKRSIELSRAYGLYRQDYCGCVFSRNSSRGI